HRAGANLDLPVFLPNAGQAGHPRDVDQDLRLAQAKLHERDEAVAAGDEFSLAIGRAELRQRIVERGGAAVIERRRDHDCPPWPCGPAWMIRHSFSGRSIMSMCFTPNSLSAST